METSQTNPCGQTLHNVTPMTNAAKQKDALPTMLGSLCNVVYLCFLLANVASFKKNICGVLESLMFCLGGTSGGVNQCGIKPTGNRGAKTSLISYSGCCQPDRKA